jgi:hypothetical protein
LVDVANVVAVANRSYYDAAKNSRCAPGTNRYGN